MTSPTPKTTTRRARKPHNASAPGYGSFNELLSLIADERRAALVGEQQIIMSRRERLFRLLVDRALQGNVREVTLLLRLMANSPALAATYRDQVVTIISGALCNV